MHKLWQKTFFWPPEYFKEILPTSCYWKCTLGVNIQADLLERACQMHLESLILESKQVNSSRVSSDQDTLENPTVLKGVQLLWRLGPPFQLVLLGIVILQFPLLTSWTNLYGCSGVGILQQLHLYWRMETEKLNKKMNYSASSRVRWVHYCNVACDIWWSVHVTSYSDFRSRYLKLHARIQHEPGRQENGDLSHLDEQGQDSVG